MLVRSQYCVRGMAGRLENVAASYERILSGQVAMPAQGFPALRVLRSVTPEADFWSTAQARSENHLRFRRRLLFD
jgi:hypothetical protein